MERFSYLRNRYKTNWQTESHREKEDVALQFMVHRYFQLLKFMVIQPQRKTKVVFVKLLQ